MNNWKCLIALPFIVFSSNNHAAPINFTFEGVVSLEKININFFDAPVDPSIYENLEFSLNISANTDTITSQYLAGLGTNYKITGTNAELNIQSLGTINLDNSKVSSIPGVFVAGFSWGGIDFSTRDSVSFYGTTSFLNKDIYQDDVYLRTDWFDNPVVVFADDTLRINSFSSVTYSVSSVPIPPSIILFLSGLGLLFKTSIIKRFKKNITRR